MRRVLFIKMVIVLFELTSATECDMETDIELDDGTMGFSPDFNWLGLLQVFLNDGDGEQVVVTGLILVKPRHALASADDIIRIPDDIFQKSARALFIADDGVQMNYSTVVYVIHPEYEAETFNTVAMVELDIGDNSPLTPICLPSVSFDSRHLYLTGFTDENKILEKMFYRILYVDKEDCDEFYKQEGLVDKTRRPVWYVCGRWQIASKPCVWDNGMALVSNSSGWFTLIGISVHGPGCGAPARFINLMHYNAWIRNITHNFYVTEEDYDYLSPDNYDLDLEFVPIHKTFTEFQSSLRRQSITYPYPYGSHHAYWDQWNYDRWQWNQNRYPHYRPKFLKHQYTKWPFPVDTLQHYRIVPSYKDPSVLNIVAFDTKYELDTMLGVCNDDYKFLRYAENFHLNTSSRLYGTAYYRFTTYDLKLGDINCITLSVVCENRSLAHLWFREQNIASFLFDDEDITQPSPYEVSVTMQSPLTNMTLETLDENDTLPDGTDRNKKYKHPFLNLTVIPHQIRTYELAIKFEFKRYAVLRFKMYTGTLRPESGGYNNVIYPRRRAFMRLKKVKSPKRKKHWKFAKDVIDRTVKQAALVADHDVMMDTVSRGTCWRGLFELILVGFWFSCLCLMRYL